MPEHRQWQWFRRVAEAGTDEAEVERKTGETVPGTEAWFGLWTVDTAACDIPETKDIVKAAATCSWRVSESATMLLTPEMWRMSEVNSDT